MALFHRNRFETMRGNQKEFLFLNWWRITEQKIRTGGGEGRVACKLPF